MARLPHGTHLTAKEMTFEATCVVVPTKTSVVAAQTLEFVYNRGGSQSVEELYVALL